MPCTFQPVYTDNSSSSEENSAGHEKTSCSLAGVGRRPPPTTPPQKKISPLGDFNLLCMYLRAGDISVPHQLSHAHKLLYKVTK